MKSKLVHFFITLCFITLGPLLAIGIEATDLTEPYYVYKAYGDRERRLGNFEEALDYYQMALSIKEEYPECYFWSSIIYYQKEYYTLSLNFVNKALEYKDNFEEPIFYVKSMFLKFTVLARLSHHYNSHDELDKKAEVDRYAFEILEDIKNHSETEDALESEEAKSIYASSLNILGYFFQNQAKLNRQNSYRYQQLSENFFERAREYNAQFMLSLNNNPWLNSFLNMDLNRIID